MISQRDLVLIIVQSNWINCLIDTRALTIIYKEPLGLKKSFSNQILSRLSCTKIILMDVSGFLFSLSLSQSLTNYNLHLPESHKSQFMEEKRYTSCTFILAKKLRLQWSYSYVFSSCTIYPSITHLSTSLLGFIFVSLSIDILIMGESLGSSSFDLPKVDFHSILIENFPIFAFLIVMLSLLLF